MSIENLVRNKLQTGFAPVHLDLVNESYKHNVPPDSETHFRLVLVSDRFTGKRAVARHQLVYQALSEEMSGGIHALALHTYSPSEWSEDGDDKSPASPPCLGGSAVTGER